MSEGTKEYWGEFTHTFAFALILTLLIIGWLTTFKVMAAHAGFLPKGLSDLFQSV